MRRNDNDISIAITFSYMKVAGFWFTKKRPKKLVRRFVAAYSLCALIVAMLIVSRDMYFTLNDFTEVIYTGCNVVTVGMVLFKLLISYAYKKEFYHLVSYAKNNFWHTNYDPNEQAILDNCKRTCAFLICAFSFFSQGTVVGYILRPIAANIGRNDSERILPFNLWIKEPNISLSPYFELACLVEMLALIHVGACYLCFDNFLCIMNLHAAGQFRILQYRLTNVYVANGDEKKQKTDKYYATFRGYIKQHQMLIKYCNKLEDVFNLMVLAQLLLFSLLICLDGYLVLMDAAPRMTRITFFFHLMGCTSQLLMFTYSCDCLIQESMNIANAAYRSPWTNLPLDEMGKTMRRDMLLVILRSRVPCCLTAKGFFVVSLETYTKVLSTAVSYFTLLNQY